MKRTILFVLFNILFLSIFSQKTNQSFNDSVNMSKAIKINNEIVNSKKTIVFNSILGTLFTISGIVFTTNSIKERNNAESVRFITHYSSTSSEWTRDLKYSYKNYEEYSNYVVYQNSIFNESKNQYIKNASSSQLIGLFSFLGTGYSGLRIVLSLNRINNLKIELK